MKPSSGRYQFSSLSKADMIIFREAMCSLEKELMFESFQLLNRKWMDKCSVEAVVNKTIGMNNYINWAPPRNYNFNYHPNYFTTSYKNMM